VSFYNRSCDDKGETPQTFTLRDGVELEFVPMTKSLTGV